MRRAWSRRVAARLIFRCSAICSGVNLPPADIAPGPIDMMRTLPPPLIIGGESVSSMISSPLNPLRRDSVIPFMFATTSFFMYLSGNSNAISKSFAIDVLFGPDRVDLPSIASVFIVATLSPPSAARTPASTLFTSALWPTTSTSAAAKRRQSLWKARFIGDLRTKHRALGTWHLALGTWHLALGTWHLALGTIIFTTSLFSVVNSPQRDC